jgi:hypothetical protein
MIFICPICLDTMSLYGDDPDPPTCCMDMQMIATTRPVSEIIARSGFGASGEDYDDMVDLDDIVRGDRIAAQQTITSRQIGTSTLPKRWTGR